MRKGKSPKWVDGATATIYLITQHDIGLPLKDFGNNIHYVVTNKDVGKRYLHIEYINGNKDGFFIPPQKVK